MLRVRAGDVVVTDLAAVCTPASVAWGPLAFYSSEDLSF